MTENKFMEVYQPYGLAKAVVENPNNPETRSNLEGLIRTELPNLPTLRSKASDEVVLVANQASKTYQDRVVDYVNSNVDNLVGDVVNEKNALSMLLTLDTNTKDEEASLINEVKAGMATLDEAQKNPEVAEAIKENLLNGDFGKILANWFDYNPSMVLETYSGVVGMMQRNLINKFAKDGKLDIGAVRGYVARNLRAVPEEEKVQTYTGFANIVANSYQKQEAKKGK